MLSFSRAPSVFITKYKADDHFSWKPIKVDIHSIVSTWQIISLILSIFLFQDVEYKQEKLETLIDSHKKLLPPKSSNRIASYFFSYLSLKLFLFLFFFFLRSISLTKNNLMINLFDIKQIWISGLLACHNLLLKILNLKLD